MKIKTFLEHISSDEDEIHDRFESEYGIANNSQNRHDFSHKLSKEGKYDVSFIKKTLLERPFSFKNKSQLDKMSEKQVNDYRYNIILGNANYMSKQERESKVLQSDWKHYTTELDVYIAVRFKESIYKTYDGYIENSEKSDDESLSRSDRDLFKLLASILKKKDGYRMMFNVGIAGNLDKIVEFKYILGLESELDDEILKTLTKIWKKNEIS